MFCSDCLASWHLFLQLTERFLNYFKLLSLRFCHPFRLGFRQFLFWVDFDFWVVIYKVISLIFAKTNPCWHYFNSVAFATRLNCGMKNWLAKTRPNVKKSRSIKWRHIIIVTIFYVLHTFKTWDTLKCCQKCLHRTLKSLNHEFSYFCYFPISKLCVRIFLPFHASLEIWLWYLTSRAFLSHLGSH